MSMNNVVSDTLVDKLVVGECRGNYYGEENNSVKACYNTVVNNRYAQSLPSLTGGSTSQLLYNPKAGLTQMVACFQFPTGLGAGLALPSMWGAALIDEIQYRIGSSTQYSITNAQAYIAALGECEDSGKKQTLADLAGAAVLNCATASQEDLTAYVVIKLPFTSPSALHAPLPLSSDILTQPIQVAIRLKRFEDVFLTNSAAGSVALPQSLTLGTVTFKEVEMTNNDYISRRLDMNRNAISLPMENTGFQNYEVKNTLKSVSGSTPQQITLTGFKEGQVKSISLWCRKKGSKNPYEFVPLKSVKLSINGLIYYQTTQSEAQMWSLLERETPASFEVSHVEVAATPSDGFVASPVVSQWVHIPFAQVAYNVAGVKDQSFVDGLSIRNSVVNLEVSLQDDADGDYELSASYNMNAVLLMSAGNAEWAFA